MKSIRNLPLVLMVVFAACAATPPHLTLPEVSHSGYRPDTLPSPRPVAARLVSFPGTEVARVSNAGDEVYVFDRVYYCFFKGDWFYARGLGGPWIYIEMKRVPQDLFRVRGRLPTGIDQRLSRAEDL